MSETAPQIRVMTPADIPAGLRLCAQAGWNQTRADWERLLKWEPEGCFAAGAEDGEAIATVTTTVYGDRLAWVGMMLVDLAHRRRGLGRALLAHAVDWLENVRGVQTVGLDATPLGKTLYDGMGFVDQYTLKRYQGTAPDVESPSGIHPLREKDLTDLAGLDVVAFGADRLRVIESLMADPAVRCQAARTADGDLQGYACSRPGARAWYVGPLVAVDAPTADSLLRAALAPLAGEGVFVDAPDDNTGAVRLVERLGFQAVRPFIRMTRGAAMLPADRSRCFAIAGPEIG